MEEIIMKNTVFMALIALFTASHYTKNHIAGLNTFNAKYGTGAFLAVQELQNQVVEFFTTPVYIQGKNMTILDYMDPEYLEKIFYTISLKESELSKSHFIFYQGHKAIYIFIQDLIKQFEQIFNHTTKKDFIFLRCPQDKPSQF